MPDDAQRQRIALRFRVWMRTFLPTLFLATGCASPQWTAEPVYFPPPPSPPHAVHLKSFNSLDAVVPFRPTFGDLLRGGPIRPFVETPAGIAYQNGHLYICDTGLRTVHDWDLSTGNAKRLGTGGEHPLITPIAVAVDPRGTVYVADTGRGEIVSFDATGASGAAFKAPNRDAYRPVALTIRGEELLVADVTGAQVDAFFTADGHLTRSIAASGANQQFFPMGLAVDATGRTYVADMMGGRVLVFGSDQTLTQTIGQRGDRYGDMGQPRHLAVGSDGVLFVADAEFAHVHLFNEAGQLLMFLGGPQDQPGGTPLPVGVAIAPTLPDRLASLVPADFNARYFLFVSNSVGSRRISLFAVGERR
jgi:sugar lactone lactonase YvrE